MSLVDWRTSLGEKFHSKCVKEEDHDQMQLSEQVIVSTLSFLGAFFLAKYMKTSLDEEALKSTLQADDYDDEM